MTTDPTARIADVLRRLRRNESRAEDADFLADLLTAQQTAVEEATPVAPEAPHLNPDFAECWQSGWRAGYKAVNAALAVLQRERDEARAVLKDVETAINPRDFGGISLHEWGGRLRAAAAKIAGVVADRNAAPKVEVLDALHDVFTLHGIASRSDLPYALIGDLVSWAAAMCRQTQATRADAAERARDEQVNEIWEDVLRSVQRAWPEPHDYGDCPTELIAELIDERDTLRRRADAAERERDDARIANALL